MLRERILGDSAHAKGHGRRHVNSNLAIDSYANLDYLPCPVEKREHLVTQEGAPSLFSNMNVVPVHAPFFFFQT